MKSERCHAKCELRAVLQVLESYSELPPGSLLKWLFAAAVIGIGIQMSGRTDSVSVPLLRKLFLIKYLLFSFFQHIAGVSFASICYVFRTPRQHKKNAL